MYSSDGLLWEGITSELPVYDFGGRLGQNPYSILNDRLYIMSRYEDLEMPHGGQVALWRSSNGISWNRTGMDVFGDNNAYLSSMEVFYNKLYVGTENRRVNGGTGTEVWRSSNGITWERVASNGFDSESNETSKLISYKGYLYASNSGTYTYAYEPGGGYEVDEPMRGKIWRTRNGADWDEVTSGFSDGSNIRMSSMEKCDDNLFAGTYNRKYGSGIWQTDDGVSWTQINENGFGSAKNVVAAAMEVYDGKLIVVTKDGSAGSKYIEENPTKIFYATCSEEERVLDRERLAFTSKDEALADRLSGRILIQTEEEGEAWYVNPTDNKKYYLGRS